MSQRPTKLLLMRRVARPIAAAAARTPKVNPNSGASGVRASKSKHLNSSALPAFNLASPFLQNQLDGPEALKISGASRTETSSSSSRTSSSVIGHSANKFDDFETFLPFRETVVSAETTAVPESDATTSDGNATKTKSSTNSPSQISDAHDTFSQLESSMKLSLKNKRLDRPLWYSFSRRACQFLERQMMVDQENSKLGMSRRVINAKKKKLREQGESETAISDPRDASPLQAEVLARSETLTLLDLLTQGGVAPENSRFYRMVCCELTEERHVVKRKQETAEGSQEKADGSKSLEPPSDVKKRKTELKKKKLQPDILLQLQQPLPEVKSQAETKEVVQETAPKEKNETKQHERKKEGKNRPTKFKLRTQIETLDTLVRATQCFLRVKFVDAEFFSRLPQRIQPLIHLADGKVIADLFVSTACALSTVFDNSQTEGVPNPRRKSSSLEKVSFDVDCGLRRHDETDKISEAARKIVFANESGSILDARESAAVTAVAASMRLSVNQGSGEREVNVAQLSAQQHAVDSLVDFCLTSVAEALLSGLNGESLDGKNNGRDSGETTDKGYKAKSPRWSNQRKNLLGTTTSCSPSELEARDKALILLCLHRMREVREHRSIRKFNSNSGSNSGYSASRPSRNSSKLIKLEQLLWKQVTEQLVELPTWWLPEMAATLKTEEPSLTGAKSTPMLGFDVISQAADSAPLEHHGNQKFQNLQTTIQGVPLPNVPQLQLSPNVTADFSQILSIRGTFKREFDAHHWKRKVCKRLAMLAVRALRTAELEPELMSGNEYGYKEGYHGYRSLRDAKSVGVSDGANTEGELPKQIPADEFYIPGESEEILDEQTIALSPEVKRKIREEAKKNMNVDSNGSNGSSGPETTGSTPSPAMPTMRGLRQSSSIQKSSPASNLVCATALSQEREILLEAEESRLGVFDEDFCDEAEEDEFECDDDDDDDDDELDDDGDDALKLTEVEHNDHDNDEDESKFNIDGELDVKFDEDGFEIEKRDSEMPVAAKEADSPRGDEDLESDEIVLHFEETERRKAKMKQEQEEKTRKAQKQEERENEKRQLQAEKSEKKQQQTQERREKKVRRRNAEVNNLMMAEVGLRLAQSKRMGRHDFYPFMEALVPHLKMPEISREKLPGDNGDFRYRDDVRYGDDSDLSHLTYEGDLRYGELNQRTSQNQRSSEAEVIPGQKARTSPLARVKWGPAFSRALREVGVRDREFRALREVGVRDREFRALREVGVSDREFRALREVGVRDREFRLREFEGRAAGGGRWGW